MTDRGTLTIYRSRSCRNGVSTRDRAEDGSCMLCSGPFDGPPAKPPQSARAEIAALRIDGARGRIDCCPVCHGIDIARTSHTDGSTDQTPHKRPQGQERAGPYEGSSPFE